MNPFHFNPRAGRTPYPAKLARILNRARALESRQWLSSWPGIAPGPTPLYRLPGLARRLGLADLAVKDESVRSPLGSFKALGAPIALVRHLLRRHPDFEPQGILAGRHADAVRSLAEAERLQSDPANWPFLALAHQALGNRAEARRWAEKLDKALIRTFGQATPNRRELLLFHREIQTLLRVTGGKQSKSPVR